MKKDVRMRKSPVVLFPFTWIAENRARELAACFGVPITLLQTTGRIGEDIALLERQAVVSPKCPVAEMDQAVHRRLGDLRAFMDVHSQKDMTFLKATAHLPYDTEALSAHIRGEILHYGRQTCGAEAEERLLNALVFLHLAEEFDRQQAAVQSELKQVEHVETAVFRKLIGEEPDGEELPLTSLNVVSAGDWEPNHPEERLRAWALLALQDTDLPAVWLTTSRLVMEALVEAVPDAARSKTSLWWKTEPENMATELGNLLGVDDMPASLPPAGNIPSSIDVYIMDGYSPRDILNELHGCSTGRGLPSAKGAAKRTILLHWVS